MNAPFVTVEEIKAATPETFPSTTYDAALRALSLRASVLIASLCRHVSFWPQLETRYYEGSGKEDQWIEDLLDITTVEISSDYGDSYVTLTAGDYIKYGGPELRVDATPYALLQMSRNGTYSRFYSGHKAVRIAGVWGWHDDYVNAWEDSLDTVQNDPLTSGGTSVTVSDADGADLWNLGARFAVGQLLRCESEYMLVRAVDTELNALTVLRAQLGTAAAQHAQNTPLYIYRLPALVRQATIHQTVRWFKRGQSGFQDVAASAETGTLTYAQSLDPDVKTMLRDLGIRKTAF